MKKLLLLLVLCLMMGGLFVSGKAESATDFPKKAITIYVPWGAGGGSDTVCRTVGSVFQKYSGGKPQLVKNVPGSASVVGVTQYNTLKPDGYNVLTWNGAQTIKTHMLKTPYAPTDFKPVIRLISNYTYILVQNSSPFKTITDLVDYAKKNPGKLTMGHAGTGGGGHFSLIRFSMAAGIKLKDIPFKGGGPAAQGLLSGQTETSMNIPPEGLSNIKAGQLRALCVLAPERLPQIPDVPTAREMGIDIVYFQSRGVVVHKDTPDEIVQRLHDIYKKTIEDEEVIKKFYNMAVTVTYAGPEEYGKEITEESAMFEKIIKKNKLGDKYK